MQRNITIRPAPANLFFLLTRLKIDDLVKSRNPIKFVIPAKAGIQLFQNVLDPGFRRGDALRDFLRDHQNWAGAIQFPYQLPKIKNIYGNQPAYLQEGEYARKGRWLFWAGKIFQIGRIISLYCEN
jgi:hypothetical protein